LSLYRGYRGKHILPYNVYLLTAGTVLFALAAIIFLCVPYARFLAQFFCGLGFVLMICFLLGRIPPFAPYGDVTLYIQRILLVLLATWFLSFATVEGLIISKARTSKNSDGADYLIVLGAGLYGSVPSPSLRSRLDETIDYAKNNPNTIIIVSGGQGKGENITEAKAMHTYLVARGIDGDRIIEEDKATSTVENIRFSFDIIDSHWEGAGVPKIAILSNEYHLYRASMIAKHEDRLIALVAAETPMFSLKITYYVREYFALLKFALFS
jgi:uncharacterized SAM-binding protein YcdF (DUF218 family)